MSLLTLTEFKAAKGITDAASDTQLNALIPMVEGAIIDYCQRPFGIGTFTEKHQGTVDHLGRMFFRVINRPITIINSIDVKYFGAVQSIPVDINLLDVFENEGYAYYTYLYGNFQGILREEYRDKFYYTINYDGGLDVPPGVKLAMVTAVWDFYFMLNTTPVANNVLQDVIQSLQIGDYKEDHDVSSTDYWKAHKKQEDIILSPTVKALLQPYVYQGQSW